MESLDARDAWPPLLRPGVLAGFGAYDAWEARVLLDWLVPATEARLTAGDALSAAVCWSEGIRGWRPQHGALPVLIAQRFSSPRRPATVADPDAALETLGALVSALSKAVPLPWRPTAWPDGLTDAALGGRALTRREGDAAIARYLGVRLAGSWLAYQGKGVRSVMASVVSAYALTCAALAATKSSVVTVGHLTSAIRAADWLQLHLLDRDAWADWCAASEEESDAGSLLKLVACGAHVMDRCSWATPSPPYPFP